MAPLVQEKETDAFSNFVQPTAAAVHCIRRFLGPCGFFRRFIPKYTYIAEPLTPLSRKSEPFMCTTEQEVAFEQLKKVPTIKPVVNLYDPDSPVVEVHTDACSKGIAGILLQGVTDKTYLVYCVSKKTTPVEQKYNSNRLELMAVMWTLGRLQPYLLNKKLTVYTDRQEFDFDVRCRPGTRIYHVDALSQTPVEEKGNILTEIPDPYPQVFTLITLANRVSYMQQGITGLICNTFEN